MKQDSEKLAKKLYAAFDAKIKDMLELEIRSNYKARSAVTNLKKYRQIRKGL